MAGNYIELIGVAGVGKTTVAKILVDEVRKSKVNIRTRGITKAKNLSSLLLIFQTIFTIIVVVVSAPEILSFYLTRTRNTYKKTPHIRRIKRNLVTRMIVDIAVIRCLLRQPSKSIVNDEGLIGKLVSLSVLTEIEPSRMHDLIEKLLPQPGIIVYVKSSPLITLEREHKRNVKLPFFDDMAYELKEKFFYDAVLMYEAITEEVASMSNIDELSIDNTGTYDELTKEVIVAAKSIREIILRSYSGD